MCTTWIRSVVSQDSANCNGGKWIIRFKKVVSGRFWEDLVRGRTDLIFLLLKCTVCHAMSVLTVVNCLSFAATKTKEIYFFHLSEKYVFFFFLLLLLCCYYKFQIVFVNKLFHLSSQIIECSFRIWFTPNLVVYCFCTYWYLSFGPYSCVARKSFNNWN